MWLQAHHRATHQAVRSIYNRIGPVLAGLIVFRWQADLVYLLLTPAEWLLDKIAVGRESNE